MSETAKSRILSRFLRQDAYCAVILQRDNSIRFYHAMTSSDDSQARCCNFSSPHLYQTFDDNGTPILPCGKDHCTTKEGKAYTPTSTVCANAKCGKKFRPACPGIIFCCQECFEATDTQAQWEETASERKRRLAKARRTRYLNTEKGHKTRSVQNKRCYARRKAAGKVQAAYERIKTRRQAATKPMAAPIIQEITVFPR
jgi:hypothetical protein